MSMFSSVIGVLSKKETIWSTASRARSCPDQLAPWFPNIAMRTAALPGYTIGGWSDLQTSTQGWLVLAAWVTALALAALARQHITGTQPPHGPLADT